MSSAETPTERAPVGVIDIGSNEMRIEIAQVSPDGETEILERARRGVRLGQDTFVDGRLSQQTMNAAISVLRDYRRMLDTYEVEAIRAVATSAVREASNMDTFLDRIARTVDLDVEVIQTTEQVRLIVLAVLEDIGGALDLGGISLISEVGGGSTLLAILRGGEIGASQSYNIGSIRMQETLSTSREPPSRAAHLLRQHARRAVDLAKRTLGLEEAGTFLAIGGDARFAAEQIGEPCGEGALQRVAQDRLQELVEECSSRPPEDLAQFYGLPYAVAETLVPALIVYLELLEAVKADSMVVSRVSMRDGLVLDLPRYLTGKEDPQIAAGTLRSARSIGLKFDYDEAHAEHVSKLAVRLFDELSDEHSLQPRHRLLLRVAGILHDIGTFVNSSAHHKHSLYLISHSEIFGLNRDEMNIVAQTARYHRRSMPKSSHIEYTALSRPQRMIVNKLAAMLRVADALDRGHWQQVDDFQIERRQHDLVIYVRGAADLTLERRAIAKKSDLFEDVFGMHVRLEHENGAAGMAGDTRQPLSRPQS